MGLARVKVVNHGATGRLSEVWLRDIGGRWVCVPGVTNLSVQVQTGDVHRVTLELVAEEVLFTHEPKTVASTGKSLADLLAEARAKG